MTEEGKAAVDRRRVRRAEDDTKKGIVNGDKRVQQENVWGKRTGDGKKAGENGLLWGRGGWM